MTLSHIDELSGRVRGTLRRIVRGIVHSIVRSAMLCKLEEDSATHGESPGLSALSDDDVRNIFWQACNPLEPRVAVAFSSASRELWALTQALRQQLRSEHKAAAALCHRMGMRAAKNANRGLRSCKKLRKARVVECDDRRLSAADLTMLGTLGPVLPALEEMLLAGASGNAGLDGVLRLMAGLGAGALPAMTTLAISNLHVGDAGASALAAALGRGALPRLENLTLCNAAIGDAGMVTLVAALRRRSSLISLRLMFNPLGDESLAAIVAAAPGSTWPPKGGLPKLKELNLKCTQITDTSCDALISAFGSGTLPALEKLILTDIPASAAAKEAVHDAVHKARLDKQLEALSDFYFPKQVHLF